MGIRINENIFSLFVNRNLVRAGAQLNQAFSRLSSGEKINRSGDDPAGLANSHALRAKITGLQRTLMNSNEGLNLLSVAESSLGNVTDILQRMRELAVQAANSTLGSSQRLLIQEEINNLLAEIERIGSTANYNDKNLLDGSFRDLRLQVGTRIHEGIPISIEDARPSILGSIARVTGAAPVNSAAIAGTGDLRINGIAVPASVFDQISSAGGDASAIAKAAAINQIRETTKVSATANAAVYEASGASILGGSLDGTSRSLSINGVNIGALDFQSGDFNQVLRERINSFTTLTGVEATRGAGGELVLTAKDGRNIQIVTTGNMADELGLLGADGDVNTVVRGTITLTSPNAIVVDGTQDLIGFTAGQYMTPVDASTAIQFLTVTTEDRAVAALSVIDVAMGQILARRAALGAIENRLQKTIDDLMVSIENLSGADSRIRDADFAIETAKLTQAQIIQEAGIAILAQANVIPRMALSLLER